MDVSDQTTGWSSAIASGQGANWPALLLAVLFITAAIRSAQHVISTSRNSDVNVPQLCIGAFFATTGLLLGIYALAPRLHLSFNASQFMLGLLLLSGILLPLWMITLRKSQTTTSTKTSTALQQQIHLLPIGILAINPAHKIIAINDTAAQLFGYSVADLINQPLEILLLGATQQMHARATEDFLAHPMQNIGMAARRLVKGRDSKGNAVTIEVRLFHQILEGETIGLALVQNAGDSHAKHEHATIKYQRLKRAMDASEDGFWEWNPHTGAAWFNSAFYRLTNQKNNATPTWQNWQVHIHPDDIDHVKSELNHHLDSGGHFDITYRGMTHNKRWQWLRMRGAKTFDEKNHPRMGGTLTNIDVQKRNEQLLEEKTQFLDSLLNQSLAGVYIYNFERNRNTFINKQYSVITGYSMDDLSAMTESTNFAQLVHDEDLTLVLEHIQAVKNSEEGEAITLTYRLRHRKGHWVWCHSKDSILSRDEQGDAREMLGTFSDVTNLKVQAQALEESNTALERFAYSASHDLQEPLRKINAFASALNRRLKGTLDDEEALYELDRVSDAAKRMSEMISSLLSLSRYTPHKLQKHRFKFSLPLNNVLSDLDLLIQSSKAQITLEKGSTLYADMGAISHLLQNVITNSIRYAKPDASPVITLSHHKTSQGHIITIRDNGRGVAAKHIDQIFEPFSRFVDKSIPGSGMGLAICKQVVKSHGGDIQASSQPDHGLTIKITLPNEVPHEGI